MTGLGCPGLPGATVGAAEGDRQLVAHQPRAAAGEDGRPFDQARYYWLLWSMRKVRCSPITSSASCCAIPNRVWSELISCDRQSGLDWSKSIADGTVTSRKSPESNHRDKSSGFQFSVARDPVADRARNEHKSDKTDRQRDCRIRAGRT